MISAEARPRLAEKARLRTDKKTGQTLLLYPEAGLQLNPTGAEVVRRCTGQNTVAQIVDALATVYAPTAREVIEREVAELVRRLAEKGLLLVDR